MNLRSISPRLNSEAALLILCTDAVVIAPPVQCIVIPIIQMLRSLLQSRPGLVFEALCQNLLQIGKEPVLCFIQAELTECFGFIGEALKLINTMDETALCNISFFVL